jgi:hypothetical protein
VDPVPDPLLFFLVVLGIEPGPPDLYPRTLTTRPQWAVLCFLLSFVIHFFLFHSSFVSFSYFLFTSFFPYFHHSFLVSDFVPAFFPFYLAFLLFLPSERTRLGEAVRLTNDRPQGTVNGPAVGRPE